MVYDYQIATKKGFRRKVSRLSKVWSHQKGYKIFAVFSLFLSFLIISSHFWLLLFLVWHFSMFFLEKCTMGLIEDHPFPQQLLKHWIGRWGNGMWFLNPLRVPSFGCYRWRQKVTLLFDDKNMQKMDEKKRGIMIADSHPFENEIEALFVLLFFNTWVLGKWIVFEPITKTRAVFRSVCNELDFGRIMLRTIDIEIGREATYSARIYL